MSHALSAARLNAGSASAINSASIPPGEDELEVTVFGPMLGESIVVHLGFGDWMIVDSCFASGDDETPMALRYLESLDVRVDRQVKLVVATHWHDDHIAGMAKIVRRCRKSKVAISAAFTGHDFNALVELVEPSMLRRSGVSEFWEIWGFWEDVRRSPTQASAGKELFYRHDDLPARVWALSPGDRDVWLGLRRFRNFYREAVGAPFEYVPSLDPNDASVALWVTVGDNHILLGADLKTYRRAARGWKAVLDEVGVWQGSAADLFKVPHHGSMGSYEPRVWSEMLTESPVAALTPFVQGSSVLPTAEGIAAIKSHTSDAYISSPPAPALDVPGPVRQVLEEATADYQAIDIQPGRIRMRKPLTGGAWSVEVLPPATSL